MPKLKPSIVLVMKDKHLRTILAERFERDGWKVDVAEQREEGERKATRARPNVFLSEGESEVKKVKEGVKHSRSLPTLVKSKIVLLFSRAERENVDEALKAGADQVILEGTLSPKDIVKSLTRLLGDKRIYGK
jgi:DNA-binding response OmpR family regulator